MAAHLNRHTAEIYEKRLRALTPQAERRWGTMDPSRTLRHLALTFEASIGDVHAPDMSNLFTRTVIRWFLLSPVPYPHSVRMPEAATPPPRGDVEFERAAVLSMMGRFLEALEREPNRKAVHPVAGPISVRQWSIVHGKHLDHHLRQFGV